VEPDESIRILVSDFDALSKDFRGCSRIPD
jgi:hypothetical protein